jgi:hypothetical protein
MSACVALRLQSSRFVETGRRFALGMMGRPEMTSYDVTCSRKDGPDDDLRLEGLGGADWYHTIDEVIANIGRGDTYWVNNGKRVQVVVVTHAKTKRQYVTTSPDGLRQNNLLFLRECR